MKNKFILILVLLVSSLALNAAESPVIDSLLHELDRVTAHRSDYIAARQGRIAGMKAELAVATNDESRYELIGRLIDEYMSFSTDSSYIMSLQREEVARRLGDMDKIVNARLNQAKSLAETGMYIDAMNILNTVPTSAEVPAPMRPFYFHIQQTLNKYLADYAIHEHLRQHYVEQAKAYRDSFMRSNEPGSLAFVLTNSERLNDLGRHNEALDSLWAYIYRNNPDEHERAIFAWALADTYAYLGDTVKQKEQVIISAIADMKSAVREYLSLHELARILYRQGDLTRAHNYMNIAVEDATATNARLRIYELIDNYPVINGIYIDTIKDQQRKLIWLLSAISVLVLILLVVLVAMRRQMKELAKSRKVIADSNNRLNTLNMELVHSNDELSEANRAIAETSRLKNAYIGRYMDQCMSYIEKLDSFRKSIGKLEAAGKRDDLRRALKSELTTDKELKEFYENFDNTFLGLFPTFVEDFNALLRPDEAILPKREGALSTELRIFALIRLGISDSDKIARFLRYSVTTIYNYRTKVRNKALGKRDELEAELMNIGRPYKEKGN